MKPPNAPGALPFVGHLLPPMRDPLGFVLAQQRHPVVRIRLGPRTAFLVGRHDLARRVLKGDNDLFDKGGTFFDAARAVVGNARYCPETTTQRQRMATLLPDLLAGLVCWRAIAPAAAAAATSCQ